MKTVIRVTLWPPDYPCYNWYWGSSLTNWKRNWCIVWIQLPLFTGESDCWTFKLFDVWLEKKSISHWLKLPWKKCDWQRNKDSFGSIYWIGKKYVSFINQHSRVSVQLGSLKIICTFYQILTTFMSIIFKMILCLIMSAISYFWFSKKKKKKKKKKRKTFCFTNKRYQMILQQFLLFLNIFSHGIHIKLCPTVAAIWKKTMHGTFLTSFIPTGWPERLLKCLCTCRRQTKCDDINLSV